MCVYAHVPICACLCMCVYVQLTCTTGKEAGGRPAKFQKELRGLHGRWGVPLPRAALWSSLLTYLLKPEVTSAWPGRTHRCLLRAEPCGLSLCRPYVACHSHVYETGNCSSLCSSARYRQLCDITWCGSGASIWSWFPAMTLSLRSWAPLTTATPTTADVTQRVLTVCVLAKCCVYINIPSFTVTRGGDGPRRQSMEKPGALPEARPTAAAEQNLNLSLPKSGRLRQRTSTLLPASCSSPLESPTQVDGTKILTALVRSPQSF